MESWLRLLGVRFKVKGQGNQGFESKGASLGK